MNGQSFFKPNFYSPYLSMLLDKPCFSLCLFFTLTFILQTIKIQLNHSIWDFQIEILKWISHTNGNKLDHAYLMPETINLKNELYSRNWLQSL